MGKEIIDISNLSKRFGNHTIFDDISLKLERGSLVAIVGESGVGKTTLLKLIGLIDNDYEGSYRIFDVKASELSEKKSANIRNDCLGFVLQYPLLVERMTVRENILLPTIYSKEKKISEQKGLFLNKLIETLKIDSFFKEKINVLSGGQKQRIALARALINNPEVILADEPTGSLDKENTDTVMWIFKQLAEQGKTIITVTHNLQFAKQHDRVFELKDGKIKKVQ